MNIDLNSMAKLLASRKEVIIYYHVKPDGDAIGSAYALAMALQSVGIKTDAVTDDDIPDAYKYLTDRFKRDTLTVPDGIAVDSAARKRLGAYSSADILFCIDHHENNQIDADYCYVNENSSSCSEIIFELLLAMNIQITPDIADFLYTGVITDTSCFRALRTNSSSIITAGKLAEYGADVTAIARHNFMEKSPERMKLEALLCSSLNYLCNRSIVSGVITFDDFCETGISDLELKDIPMVLDQIGGIKICIVVRENKPHKCRISLRTSEEFDASEICRKYGGGGHATAAGCDIEGEPEIVRKEMEEICSQYYRGKYSENSEGDC